MEGQQIFFHPALLLLFLDPESGMVKNQDPASGINIPDPQHRPKHYNESSGSSLRFSTCVFDTEKTLLG
jgi:hypothetical protein